METGRDCHVVSIDGPGASWYNRALMTLQTLVNSARRIVPRGWSPALRGLARVYPPARRYPVQLRNGQRMILDLRENMCHTYFYWGEIPHEQQTDALLRKFLTAESVCVDAGANVGYYTQIAAGLAGRVYAFEPAPVAFELLSINTVSNHNVCRYQVALSDYEGEATFYLRDFGDTSSLDPDADARQVKVQVSTLDRMLSDAPRVDFIKIDVEGFERELLRGARETIERHRPVVYFELSIDCSKKLGYCFDDFKPLLPGYHLTEVNEAAPYVLATP